MNTDEMIDRAATLPDRFADRLPAEHTAELRRIEGGGEWALLVANTIAALAQAKAPVTRAERDDLAALAFATGEGTEYLDTLMVRA
jgi:hypothetical protein